MARDIDQRPPKRSSDGLARGFGAALARVSAVAALTVACVDTVEVEGAGIARQPIVYGSDDRVEVRDGDAPAPIVALIPRATLWALADGGAPATFEVAHQTCPGERFSEQPAIATCSGVMLAPDLLVTAAHCLEQVSSCTDYAYVLDYAVQADGGVPAPMDLEQLGCNSVVVQTRTSIIDDRYLDFAVIRLDRAVSPFERVALRRTSVQRGEPVTAVGANGGLPLKAARGVVRDVRTAGDYFEFNADVFAGGSGSGIFDDDGALMGIEVRGGADFELTEEGCYRSRIVPEDDADAEEANTLSSIIEGLCRMEPGLELCEPAIEAVEPELGSEPPEPASGAPELPRPLERPRGRDNVPPDARSSPAAPENGAPRPAPKPDDSVSGGIDTHPGCSLADRGAGPISKAVLLLVVLFGFGGRRISRENPTAIGCRPGRRCGVSARSRTEPVRAALPPWRAARQP